MGSKQIDKLENEKNEDEKLKEKNKLYEAIKNYDLALENEIGGTAKTGDDIKYKAKFFKGIAYWQLG